MKLHNKIVVLAVTGFFLSGCFANPSLSSAKKNSREGDRLFSSGKIDKAIEKWAESLEYKQNAGLYEKIITAVMLKNDLAEAKKWTCRGLTYFPNNVNLAFNLALIEFYGENLKGSLDALERVLNLNKYYPNAHFLKGLIYEKTGDKISARKEFVSEININPGSKGAWQKLRGSKND